MLKMYNTLTRSVEPFKSIHPLQVGMYTCGPTVYDFAHIGNFRTYMAADLLVRTLKYNGYDVTWIMNITDVGHLVSDGDEGEDKMEKGSRRTGQSAWEIAEFFTDIFLKDWKSLNMLEPTKRPRPTKHIPEQIALVQKLLDKEYAYRIDDGIYFDTSKYKDYGKLAHLDLKHLKEGARVEINPQKRNPTDFALWKFSPVDEKRQMEWKSPWKKGFPGWHIECSAMSMKYLGEQFDIHSGGMDILPVHHVNEVAQSEAATGKHPWVNYWIHGQMMLIEGQKMSKSLGNIYRLYDLEKENYDLLALRYLYMQTHYRQEMNFTFAALEAAQNAYKKLVLEVTKWGEPEGSVKELEEKFLDAINDDLNMSQALAVMWELVKSDHPTNAKAASLFKMDRVLGLNLQEMSRQIKQAQGIIPGDVQHLVEERQRLRKEKRFNAADKIRSEIEKLGYVLEDTKKGIKVKKKN